MDYQQLELTRLIKGHVDCTLTEMERQRLAALVSQHTQARDLLDAFQDTVALTAKLERLDSFQQHADWKAVIAKQRRKRVWRWTAGLCTAATIGAFLLM